MKLQTPGILASFEDEIKESIGRPRFELWFGGNTNLTLTDDGLEIGVPNRFYRDWLERHFEDELRQAAGRAFGAPLPVRIRIDPALFRRVAPTRQAETSIVAPRPLPAAPAVKPSRFDLDRFVVGPPNKVAHAAASSLIERPRHGYSPLFLFSGIGLGKTHLMKGIELGLTRRHSDLRVLGLSGEEFTNEYIESMKVGKLQAFRRKVRHVDVFLVDGVQFLCGKRATQVEFFHTLNSLQTRGAKVVLSADTHPRKLPKISEELKSRFVSGIVAKLDPPNLEMRRRIIDIKAAQRKMSLTAEVRDLLATQLRSTVGEIEGALNYLEHFCETLDRPIDLSSAKTALNEVLRHSVPVVRVGDVVKKACEVFGLNPKGLRARDRTRTVSHPRMLVLYLARKYTPSTYSEIGRQIGGLNHSTVIAAEKKIASLLKRDGEIVLGERHWKVRDAIEAFERDLGRV